MTKYKPWLTVGELIERLEAFDKDLLVDFSQLDFNRLKQRSPSVLQVEFAQMVYRDKNGDVQVDNLE